MDTLVAYAVSAVICNKLVFSGGSGGSGGSGLFALANLSSVNRKWNQIISALVRTKTLASPEGFYREFLLFVAKAAAFCSPETIETWIKKFTIWNVAKRAFDDPKPRACNKTASLVMLLSKISHNKTWLRKLPSHVDFPFLCGRGFLLDLNKLMKDTFRTYHVAANLPVMRRKHQEKSEALIRSEMRLAKTEAQQEERLEACSKRRKRMKLDD